MADAEIVFGDLEREDVSFRDDRRLAELKADDVAFERFSALLDAIDLRLAYAREDAANQVAGRRNGTRSRGTLQKQNHFLPLDGGLVDRGRKRHAQNGVDIDTETRHPLIGR